MAYKILNISQALAKDYINEKITIEEAAQELHRAGLINYIPDKAEALRLMGLNSMCWKCTRSECRGTTCQTWTGCIYRTA